MAIALLGPSYSQLQQFCSEHSRKQVNCVLTKDVAPLLASANIQLYDAVIHFRCGDLMNSIHPRYSLMSFHDYTRFRSAEARSIGILTRSFDCAVNRLVDSKQVLCDRCRIVVMSLVEYIQQKFPKANKVTIRNDKKGTTASNTNTNRYTR